MSYSLSWAVQVAQGQVLLQVAAACWPSVVVVVEQALGSTAAVQAL